MADTIKTTIHAYCFDISKPDGKVAWLDLKARLKETHPHCMESHGGQGHYHFVRDLDGQEIDLETAHLFDNQWNTGPTSTSDKGLRVFDWALDYCNGTTNPRHLKRGHYLDQTDAMREIRRNTDACPYCGKQEPAAKGNVFCPHCLDSEYLTEADLLKGITRMRPVYRGREDLKPLTDAERAHLVPQYRAAQLHGNTERGKARIIKQREDIEKHARAVIRAAETERAGKLWLMDHGVNISNVIYYSHTGRFGFGWRQPMGADLVSGLLDIITEFPFPYDIECEGGKKLSGER